MVYDLYNAKAGDVVNLSNDELFLLSNIYDEALSYNLVPYIDYAPVGKHYVAKLVDVVDSSVAALATTLARATLNQEDPVEFSIPDNFNIDNLVRMTRRAMCILGMKGTHTLTGSLLTLSHKPDLVEVMNTLKSLEPDEKVTIKSVAGMKDKKLRSLIYRLGNQRGFKVSANACEGGFSVVYKSGNYVKPVKPVNRVYKVPIKTQFKNTVEMMQWDILYPFKSVSPSCLRVLASQHPLRCLTVRGDSVIKRLLMVGKYNGKVAVLFKGEPVLVLDATSKKQLTARQQVQIEDTMMIYKDKDKDKDKP